ncbi:hypothetical protein WDW89_19195 [Deltaproteobacteria bacterium TL4]
MITFYPSETQSFFYEKAVGPWSEVRDDDHHILKRGVPTAVCDKTFQIYSREPYAENLILVSPRTEVPLAEAKPFDCAGSSVRHPRETKGMEYRETVTNPSTCLEGGCC